MKFATERLEIKPISLADQEAVLDLLTNETVGKTYMLPIYQNRAEAVPLFQRLVQLSADESRFVAGVYLDGKFIGMMNDPEIKDDRIEVGYCYLPAYYNQGYATEAFRGAIDYLFARGFATVLAGAFAENPASLRVMEKCGMVKQEYTDEIEYRGVTHTCIYYAAKKSQ
jgi:ribosomal-protein-alanine N-acetyltransferase